MAVVGLGVSGYLTAVRAAGDSPTCVIGGGCHTVQPSEYSELAGIPVDCLGLAAYAGLLVAAILPGQAGRALGLFTAVVSFGFSAWLTYAELVLIDAVCAWCVTERDPGHARADHHGDAGSPPPQPGRKRSSVSARPPIARADPRIEHDDDGRVGRRTARRTPATPAATAPPCTARAGPGRGPPRCSRASGSTPRAR